MADWSLSNWVLMPSWTANGWLMFVKLKNECNMQWCKRKQIIYISINMHMVIMQFWCTCQSWNLVLVVVVECNHSKKSRSTCLEDQRTCCYVSLKKILFWVADKNLFYLLIAEGHSCWERVEEAPHAFIFAEGKFLPGLNNGTDLPREGHGKSAWIDLGSTLCAGGGGGVPRREYPDHQSFLSFLYHSSCLFSWSLVQR